MSKCRHPSTSPAGQSVCVDDVKFSVHKDNQGPLTFDTVSAQPSTSQAFCLVSFRVVRSLSNRDVQSFVSDPGKQTGEKSCGHLRELPHVVNLVQPANLREPRANRRDKTTTSLDSSSPKWVDAIAPVNQRRTTFESHTPCILPFQKGSRVQLANWLSRSSITG